MAIAKIEELPKFDSGRDLRSWKERRADGKELRRQVPRESHSEWKPGRNRPDPLKLLAESNKGRRKHLIPLRMGRMAASPFAFLRGSACVMASDLSTTPISGIPVIIDGDAHLNNFGMYGTPQREVVFDLNDFDEAIIGPWEWDLKRLAASVNVAGQANGLNRRERAIAVKQSVSGYRFNVHRLESIGVLDVWYLHYYPGRSNPLRKMNPKVEAVFSKTLDKAMRTDNRALLPKVAERTDSGEWRFKEDPPVLTSASASKERSSRRSTGIRNRFRQSGALCLLVTRWLRRRIALSGLDQSELALTWSYCLATGKTIPYSYRSRSLLRLRTLPICPLCIRSTVTTESVS